MFLETTYVVASLFSIKSRYLNENFVTKPELGYVKTLLQREYNNRNLNAIIIDGIDSEYFEDLGDIIILNKNNNVSLFTIENKAEFLIYQYLLLSSTSPFLIESLLKFKQEQCEKLKNSLYK